MNWLLIQIIVLFILIYGLSRLVIQNLFALSYAWFRQTSGVVSFISFFLLLGTFLHEVGHLLVAEFMGVSTADLSLLPKVKEDHSIQLGGVKIAQTDAVRRTLIGLAPVFFGLVVIWVSTYFMSTLTLGWPIWLLYGYLLMQISLTMFSSSKDLEGVAVGLILIALLLLGIRSLGQIIIFAPLVRVQTMVGEFFMHNLFYLRNGLIYCALINFGLLVISRFSRLTRAVR